MKYPHIAVQHIRKRIKPQELKYRINDNINVRRAEKIHKKDLKAFIK